MGNGIVQFVPLIGLVLRKLAEAFAEGLFVAEPNQQVPTIPGSTPLPLRRHSAKKQTIKYEIF
jgi:hypothetical protein